MVFRLIVAFLLFTITIGNANAEKRTALVIANGDYAELPDVNKALSDARSLREALTNSLGFDVVYGENLNRRDMNRKINELDTQTGKGDIVLIYYAGHGVSLDGENYMLPVDSQDPEPGEEKFVIGDSVGASALIRKIKEKGAKTIFIILDACHENPLNIGLENGLDRIETAEGVFIMYSAAHGKASLDGVSETDENPNSVFMRSFVQHLTSPGLTQIELARKVQDEVSAAATASGRDQIPAFEDRLPELVTLNGGSGEVVVESKEIPKQPDEATAGAGEDDGEATPTQRTADNEALILEQWKIVKDSGNRKALLGFKAKYGNDPVWGPLVDQALASLKNSQPQKAVTLKDPEEDAPDELAPPEKAAATPLYRDLQIELKRVGCYSGPVDGVWGLPSRRALARFSRLKGRSLKTNDEALEELLASTTRNCATAAPPPRKKTVVSSKPRRPVAKKRNMVRPRSSVVCWTCMTYTYESQRICVPRRLGNPLYKVSPRTSHFTSCKISR